MPAVLFVTGKLVSATVAHRLLKIDIWMQGGHVAVVDPSPLCDERTALEVAKSPLNRARIRLVVGTEVRNARPVG